MTNAQIIAGLEGGLALLKTAAPLASAVGFPQVTAIAGAVATIGQDLLQRASTTTEALTTDDEAKLKAILAETQAINDQLAAEVAAL